MPLLEVHGALLSVAAGLAAAAWIAVLLLPWQPHRVRERLEAADERPSLGELSVLIPARDEAAVIERTLAALSRQGPRLDVVVVDDESGDATQEICRAFSSNPASASGGRGPFPMTVRVVSGRPRPPGWSGKLWALQQGLALIRRRQVLLLDADIELAPGTIAALLAQSRTSRAELVSVMATLRCRAFAERLLAPAFVFFFKLLYPFALAGSRRHRTAAAAGGCVLVTADALRGIGGFAAIRGALIDDCTLAAALKCRGHGIWIGMSGSVRSLRPYGFRDFSRMVRRTAFTQLRYSTSLLLATTAAMALVFLAPLAALAAGIPDETTAAGCVALAAMSAAYLPVVRFYALPAWWALTLPAAAVLFLGMTWHSAIGYWRGVRALWKNRAYGIAE